MGRRLWLDGLASWAQQEQSGVGSLDAEDLAGDSVEDTWQEEQDVTSTFRV